MMRVLIVANQTAGGPHLREELQRRAEEGQHDFTLLVPATRPQGTITWTDSQARTMARHRMGKAIAALSDLDIRIDGVVGIAPTALDCVMDLLRERDFDEIIVSTFPHLVSRWLRLDLPRRIAYRTGKPVTHIVASVRERVSA